MLEQLKRRSALEPDNRTLQFNVVAAMAREGRSLELVAPLMDREAWSSAGEYAQGLAAIEVGRRLGSDWELSGLRVWSCENVSRTPEKADLDDRDEIVRDYLGRPIGWERNDTISHRLANFTHKPTGIEMQLLPGRRVGLLARVAKAQSMSTEEYRSHGREILPDIKPFLIARWPVTRNQFYKRDVGEWGNHPVLSMSRDIVRAQAEGNGFALPTPAQWEYACRAGSTTRFYWGNEFDPSHVWYAGNSGEPSCGTCIAEPSINHPHPPKIISPAEHDKAGRWNSFGLVDMIGNVDEWLNDSMIAGNNFSDNLSAFESGLLISGTIDGRAEDGSFMTGGARNYAGFRPVKAIDWSD